MSSLRFVALASLPSVSLSLAACIENRLERRDPHPDPRRRHLHAAHRVPARARRHREGQRARRDPAGGGSAPAAPLPHRRALAEERGDGPRAARGRRSRRSCLAAGRGRRLLPGARRPHAQPARNFVSAYVDSEQRLLRVPGGAPRPVLAARRRAGALPLRAEARPAFAEPSRGRSRRPPRAGLRRRELPTCGACTASCSPSPSRARWRRSPSARSSGRASARSSSRSTTRLDGKQKQLGGALVRRSPPGGAEEQSARRSGRRDRTRRRRPARDARGGGAARSQPRPGRAQAPLPRHARDARPDPARQHLRQPATRRPGSSTRTTSSAAASR